MNHKGTKKTEIRKRIVSSIFLFFVSSWLIAFPRAASAQDEEEQTVRVGAYEVTGAVELGWRFTAIDGSRELYRSQVDLPDGPTLAFSRVEFRSPENTGPIFDTLLVEGSGWGSEPSSHARVRVARRGLYLVEYYNRRVDTYNTAPDFANPLFEQGALVAPHGWDRTRRMQHLELTLFPERRVEGHVAFDRSAQSGLGFGTTVDVPDLVLDRALDNDTTELRGGVSLRWPTWALFAEGGTRRYDDDETSVADPLTTTDPETLAGFLRRRTTDWDAPFARLRLTANPLARLRVTARALYTDYETEGTLSERVDAAFSDPSTLEARGRGEGHAVAFDSQQTWRASDRLTLGNFFRYRRYRNSGSGSSALGFGDDPSSVVTEIDTRDYRDEVVSSEPRVEVDLARGLRARAAYRIARRESYFVRSGLVRLPGAGDFDQGIDRREDDYRVDVFLAGLSYRLRHEARFYAEYENGRDPSTFFTRAGEIAAGDLAPQTYFRGPGDYQLLRLRGSWQPREWIDLSGSVRVTNRTFHSGALGFLRGDVDVEEPGLARRRGDGPLPGEAPQQTSRVRAAGVTVRVTPEARVSFGLTYDRSRATADITYLAAIPNEQSEFERRTFFTRYEGDENAIVADVVATPASRLTLTGLYSLVSSSGSFPVHYHQAHGRAAYLFGRGVSGILEWRLYDYDDHRFEITDYRAKHAVAGVRWEF